MANTEKIFVDLNEDIVFTLEKIKQSQAPKVIVVIPKSANLTGSLISLKILSRQVSKTKKLITLVTEDSLGQRLSERAKIVCVKNVNEITPEIWEKAKELKQELLDERERTKRLLLEKRQESTDNEGVKYKILEEQSPKQAEATNLNELESKQVEDDIKKYEKQRLPAKVISLNEVKFYSAGDITNNEELLNELLLGSITKQDSDKPVEASTQGTNKETTGVTDNGKEEPKILMNEDIQSSEYGNQPQQELSQQKKHVSFVGKNLAGVISNMPKRMVGGHGFSLNNNSIKDRFNILKQKFFSEDSAKKKVIGGLVILLIIFFIFSYFTQTYANLTVTVQQDEVNISQTITADPSVRGVNIAEYKMHAEIRSTDTDASENATATGVGSTGERAKGQVEIYNFTTNPVNLAAGTKLTIIPSELVYTINNAVSIEAIAGGVPGRAENVPITATKHGDNYNSEPGKWFRVEGYSYNESGLKAKNFYPISGGSTVQTTVVSQGDMDSIKNVLKTRIETVGKSQLESLTAADEIMIPETIKVEITEETSTKNVGDEAEKFDVTVKAKVSALFIKKPDMEEMIIGIAKKQQKIEGESEINVAEMPNIQEVKYENTVATFKINTTASARAKITKESLAERLTGRSLSEVEDYLKHNPDIVSYELETGPWFIPGFMRTIPGGDRLKIRITK